MILAIDPGVEKIGYALFKRGKRRNEQSLVTSGLIKTKKTTYSEKRLQVIYEELEKLIEEHNPSELAIEKLFFFKNQKTVISVAQAQGVVVLLAAQKGMTVTYLTPLQIKQTITGYGNADKKSVHKMLKLLLKTDVSVADDDESDAIACGLAYCYLGDASVK